MWIYSHESAQDGCSGTGVKLVEVQNQCEVEIYGIRLNAAVKTIHNHTS